MITVDRLSKSFGKNHNVIDAVKSLSFNAYPGKVFCLLGENGAGKTTTIKMLSTLIKPTEGDAHINGFSILSKIDQVKTSIGLSLGDERSFYHRLTGFQNLEFFGYLLGLGKSNIKPRIIGLMENLNLLEARDIMFMHYSTGMRKRLNICRAMLSNPSVLFLDEPTSGLDPQSAFLVRTLITKYKELGKTIVLSTQNLTEAELLGDDIAIIKNGQMLLCSTIHDLMIKHSYSEIRINLCPSDAIKIYSFFEKSKIMSVRENEVAFKVPCLEKTFFLRALFQNECGHNYKVNSIEIKDDSLEDVYLTLYRKTS